MTLFRAWTWAWRLWGVKTAAEQAARKAGDAMTPKSILTSKTFWFNALAGVIGLLQSSGIITGIPAPYGPAVVALVNIVLRFVTTGPVTIR